MLNVKQNMEHIQAKQGFSILIPKKKSAVTKLSDTIKGQHFVGFFLMKKAFQKLKQPTTQKRRNGGNKFKM